MEERNQNEESFDVILLNKAFEGSWNEEEGHISHEIINFFLDDEGKNYVYFSPFGKVKDEIYVDDTEKSKTKKHKAKYLLLASNATVKYKVGEGSANSSENDEKNRTAESSTFRIKYIIKLKRLVSDCSNITYNGVPLAKIFTDGETYPLTTFEAEEIYDTSASDDNSITTEKYIYHRNRGYLYKDGRTKKDESTEGDFKKISDLVKELLKSGEKLTLKKINLENNSLKTRKPTFIDFIGKKNDENIYSNILYEILKVDGMFNTFFQYVREKFEDKKENLSNEKFTLTREQFVDYGGSIGRIDIYAESGKFGVFIENKILSDLNGIKFEKEKAVSSQISLYSNWVNVKQKKETYGILLVPNYRKTEIEKELKEYSEEGIVKILTYSDIADFVSKYIEELKKPAFKYSKYADELKDIFAQHADDDKLKVFIEDFIAAINNAKFISEVK